MAEDLPVGSRLLRRQYLVTRHLAPDDVNGRTGHRRDRPLFGFIAGKRSVKFRFPKAASRH